MKINPFHKSTFSTTYMYHIPYPSNASAIKATNSRGLCKIYISLSLSFSPTLTFFIRKRLSRGKILNISGTLETRKIPSSLLSPEQLIECQRCGESHSTTLRSTRQGGKRKIVIFLSLSHSHPSFSSFYLHVYPQHNFSFLHQ